MKIYIRVSQYFYFIFNWLGIDDTGQEMVLTTLHFVS